ncbi:MAG: hypothetical protein JWQ98_136 [Chlorobi bacterium]|nr:hypothetical protein [Chlorobiota bacterium]
MQREIIVFPDTVVFASNGRSERTVASGPQIATSPAAISLLAGISFSLPIPRRFSLLPALNARLDLRSLRDGMGLRSISGGAGITLARLDARGLYANELTIIGLRLRSDRKLTIRLTGSVSADEPARLAAARADAVREYLTERWGIERSRIGVRGGGAAVASDDDRYARSVTVAFPAPVPGSSREPPPLRRGSDRGARPVTGELLNSFNVVDDVARQSVRNIVPSA